MVIRYQLPNKKVHLKILYSIVLVSLIILVVNFQFLQYASLSLKANAAGMFWKKNACAFHSETLKD